MMVMRVRRKERASAGLGKYLMLDMYLIWISQKYVIQSWIRRIQTKYKFNYFRFTGLYCEINLCHNYCFRGNCSINSDGLPTCKCNNAFIGPRCETDLCKDYCLHDGQCSVQDEKPVCKCKYSEGSRCEILGNAAELCEIICTTERVPTSIVTAHCRYIAFEKFLTS